MIKTLDQCVELTNKYFRRKQIHKSALTNTRKGWEIYLEGCPPN